MYQEPLPGTSGCNPGLRATHCTWRGAHLFWAGRVRSHPANRLPLSCFSGLLSPLHQLGVDQLGMCYHWWAESAPSSLTPSGSTLFLCWFYLIQERLKNSRWLETHVKIWSFHKGLQLGLCLAPPHMELWKWVHLGWSWILRPRWNLVRAQASVSGIRITYV